MATGQNAAPANARHTTSATRPHAQNARVQSVRAQTVRATTVPEPTSSAATTINAHLRHAQKDPMQAPARMALAQKAPVTKVSALIARSVQQARTRGTPSIAVRTDRVPSVRTLNVQTLIVHTPNAHIAANRTPLIVPITPVSHQVTVAAIGVANAKAAASKIGTASARQNS